jgi:hypothetical protein
MSPYQVTFVSGFCTFSTEFSTLLCKRQKPLKNAYSFSYLSGRKNGPPQPFATARFFAGDFLKTRRIKDYGINISTTP